MHREKQFLGKKERTLGREDVLLALASKKSRKFEALCRVLGLRDASGVKKLREILAGLEGVSGSDAQKAADLLENDTVEGEAGGIPLAYWKEWKDADPARFIPYVRVPVLMLECGEESEVWKERLGSAAETKCYEDLTEGFRDKDGSLSEDVGEDILKWLRGEDIHEEEKKPEVKKKS